MTREHKREITDKEVLEAAKETKAEIPVNKSKGGITVHGIHDVAVRFSKCCSPHSRGRDRGVCHPGPGHYHPPDRTVSTL